MTIAGGKRESRQDDLVSALLSMRVPPTREHWKVNRQLIREAFELDGVEPTAEEARKLIMVRTVEDSPEELRDRFPHLVAIIRDVIE